MCFFIGKGEKDKKGFYLLSGRAPGSSVARRGTASIGIARTTRHRAGPRIAATRCFPTSATRHSPGACATTRTTTGGRRIVAHAGIGSGAGTRATVAGSASAGIGALITAAAAK